MRPLLSSRLGPARRPSSSLQRRLARGLCSGVDTAPVLVERRGKVAVLRLNRPASLNAMTAEMGDAFAEAVGQLSADTDEVGTVVVTGAGTAFSAGGDMSFLHARGRDSPWRNMQVMRRFYERFLCVRKLPVPVIAAINGPAVGAGLCLALACDVRVASPAAKMGVTFVGLGLHPGMGCTHFLPQTVGPQVAARMMLTGEMVGGAQALREGLVAALEDDPEQAAVALASRMAEQAPIAVRTCVRSLRMAQ
eukprot:scaffold2133_cov135-Isochrysis_galbana.AAC.3